MKQQGGILLLLLAMLSFLSTIVMWQKNNIKNHIVRLIRYYIVKKNDDNAQTSHVISLVAEKFIQNIVGSRFSENEFTSEVYDMYQYENFVLTSDHKYYITATHYNTHYPKMLLWDAQTKEIKYTFENYDSFVYVRNKNIILVFQIMDHEGWKNERGTIGMYDVEKESMTQVFFNHNVYNLKIDSSEKWCVIEVSNGVYIGSIENMRECQTQYQFLSESSLYFNLDSNLFIKVKSEGNTAYIDVYALQKNNTWKCVIEKYPLSFYPQDVHFMLDNYCILYQHGRHESNGFLHVKVDKVDANNGEYFVRVIDNSSGIGCITRDTSKECFACWAGDDHKQLRFVARDGYLMKEIHNFYEFRSSFSSDGRYYVATDDGFRHDEGEKKATLLLMSLDHCEANIVKHQPLNGGTHVMFSPNGKLFMQHVNDCKLYNNDMRLLRSFPSVERNQYSYNFGPDRHSIIDRTNKTRYELLPKKVINSSVMLLCFLNQVKQ